MFSGLKQQVSYSIGAKKHFQPLQVCFIVLMLRRSLEGATSCRARRLFVCYVVAFVYKRYLTCFDLIRLSSGRNIYVIAALYCSLWVIILKFG
jgi:hypothetical protein